MAAINHPSVVNTTSAASEKILPASSDKTYLATASTAGGEGGMKLDDPTARLEEMGYKQELQRNLGMISILGLSFAIMAVPFGTSTTLNIALTDGGPVTILYGVSQGRSERERRTDRDSGSSYRSSRSAFRRV
jgi:hypothetical protein